MKKYLLIALALLLSPRAKAQKHPIIQTSFGKVSHLIFPEAIEEVSIGEPLDFTLLPKGKLLKIFPSEDKYIHTNLLVKTQNEIYYSFYVENVKDTKELDYFIGEEKASYHAKNTGIDKENKGESPELPIKKKGCKMAQERLNTFEKKEVQGLLDFFLVKPPKVQNEKVKLSLLSIFVNEGNMYFKIEIANESLLNFHIHSIVFHTKSKVQKKKASLTLRKIPLLAICENLEVVPHNSLRKEIIVVNNITLSPKEELYIEIHEKPEAKRHLKLKIPHSFLLKAEPLIAKKK